MKSTSTKVAGTVVNGLMGDGSWTGTLQTLLETSDDSRTYSAITAAQTTKSLTATNFGFDIPVDAVIDGCELILEIGGGGAGDLNDYAIRLRYDSGFIGDDKAEGTDWPATDTDKTWGSSTDTWNVSGGLTPAIVNHNSFGAWVRAENNSAGARVPSVDYLRIVIHYSTYAHKTDTIVVSDAIKTGNVVVSDAVKTATITVR